MKENLTPQQENRGLSDALKKICELVKDNNGQQAIVVLPTQKGKDVFDVRTYDFSTHQLSAHERLVNKLQITEALDKLVAGGQPVLQVVARTGGRFSVRHVDTKLHPYYAEAPDGAYDEVRVGFKDI